MKFQKVNLLTGCIVATTLLAQADDNPTGALDVNAAVQQAGSNVVLDWNITYPESVEDWVTIAADGSVLIEDDVKVDVTILAADVQRRTTENGRYVYTPLRIECHEGHKRNGNIDFTKVFHGTQRDVRSENIVRSHTLGEGDELLFASRVDEPGYDYYYSDTGTTNVIVLKRGQTPPDYTTWTTQSTLGEHIGSYLADDGTVAIGPRDVIICFELTHNVDYQIAHHEGKSVDMQDMIVLLTFQKTS